MNVAVVYPEVYDLARFKDKRKEFPPFGILYLSAVAEEAGYNVSVFRISPGRETLDLRSFEVVAFSIPSSATYGVVKKSRFGSNYSKDPLVLVGGVHANFFPEQTLLDLEADAVGIGEGEETFPELLAEAGTRRFESINGIAFPAGNGVQKNAPRSTLMDIDELPIPARHLLPRGDLIMSDRLANTNVEMAHVMFSRGCPFPCRFCAAAQTKIQYRSGLSAREEMEALIECYGIGGFSIVDDNFIVNQKKVADICRSIQDLGLHWSALSRVDTVNDELLRTMREAGCIEIKFGVESGSKKVLDLMRKNIKTDDIRKALHGAAAAGIMSKVFIVHGFPGETYETSCETLNLLEELKHLISRVSLFRFVPLPGTYVFDNPEEFEVHGLDVGEDWERFHIHHNHRHWWGTATDFAQVQKGYMLLRAYIETQWPARPEHALNEHASIH